MARSQRRGGIAVDRSWFVQDQFDFHRIRRLAFLRARLGGDVGTVVPRGAAGVRLSVRSGSVPAVAERNAASAGAGGLLWPCGGCIVFARFCFCAQEGHAVGLPCLNALFPNDSIASSSPARGSAPDVNLDLRYNACNSAFSLPFACAGCGAGCGGATCGTTSPATGTSRYGKRSV